VLRKKDGKCRRLIHGDWTVQRNASKEEVAVWCGMQAGAVVGEFRSSCCQDTLCGEVTKLTVDLLASDPRTLARLGGREKI
jgi:hypothetical protein